MKNLSSILFLMINVISLKTFNPAYASNLQLETDEKKVLTKKRINYEQIKEHSLLTESIITASAYDRSTGGGKGSAFWMGGNSNIIVTNNHVASISNQGMYYVIDGRGKRIETEIVYENPLLDLAYLRPKKGQSFTIPQTRYEFNLNPSENEKVWVIGNNGGCGIGMHKGTITDIYTIGKTTYPVPTISVSVNSKGGSSGSALLDQDGKIIGVIYATSDISTLAIPVHFLKEDLEFLEKGEIPPKKDVGLVFSHISANEAKNYLNFKLTEEFMDENYNKEFKGAKSRLLIVEDTINGTHADEYFQLGDILLEVNGRKVGPFLYTFYNTLNDFFGPKIPIKFIREGTVKEIDVPLYDLNKVNSYHSITFGKAIFVSINQIQSYRTGIEVGKIGVFHNPPGSILGPAFNFTTSIHDKNTALLEIIQMAENEIQDIESLHKTIKKIAKEKKFIFVIRNYGIATYDNRLATNQNRILKTGNYDDSVYPSPTEVIFDLNESRWVKKVIEL